MSDNLFTGGSGAPSDSGAASGTPAPASGAPAAVVGDASPPAAGGFQWADESGKFSDGWLEKAGYKDDPTLTTIKDLPTLAKAYKETKALVGRKLSPPGEGSTPEQVAEWRKLVGAPDKPEDYGTLMPEGYANKEQWNAAMEQEAVAIAHKHHIPPAAIKELVALQVRGEQQSLAAMQAAQQKALDDGSAALRAEWGDQSERRMHEVNTAVTSLTGFPSLLDMLSAPPHEVAKRLATSAPTIFGQDKLVKGDTVTVTGGLEDQINAIRDGADYQGKNGEERQQRAAAQLRQKTAALFSSKKPLTAA